MTPGAVLDVSDTDVCTPGYSSRVRHVTAETKREVYAEYGVTVHAPGDYEIDHLISLEIGGSNSIKNLWPQSYLHAAVERACQRRAGEPAAPDGVRAHHRAQDRTGCDRQGLDRGVQAVHAGAAPGGLASLSVRPSVNVTATRFL